jgi:hypothetical protein
MIYSIDLLAQLLSRFGPAAQQQPAMAPSKIDAFQETCSCPGQPEIFASRGP